MDSRTSKEHVAPCIHGHVADLCRLCLKAELARTESARVAILAENAHYKDACSEFVRMQHDIASLLGVDAETDSIDLHGRIYGELQKRAADEPPAAPSNSSAERAWLLETNWGPYIHYFGPQGGVRSRGGGHIGTEPHEFTKDVNRATLFRSKKDGEQFLQWMQANIRHSWLGWKVSEHEWVAPRTAEPPGDVHKQLSDARLNWAMRCFCDCSACKEFDAVVMSLAETKAPTLVQSVCDRAIHLADVPSGGNSEDMPPGALASQIDMARQSMEQWPQSVKDDETKKCCQDAPEGMHHPRCLTIGSPATRASAETSGDSNV